MTTTIGVYAMILTQKTAMVTLSAGSDAAGHTVCAMSAAMATPVARDDARSVHGGIAARLNIRYSAAPSSHHLVMAVLLSTDRPSPWTDASTACLLLLWLLEALPRRSRLPTRISASATRFFDSCERPRMAALATWPF